MKENKYPIGTLVYHRHIGLGVVVEVAEINIAKPPFQYSVKWTPKEGVSFYNEFYMEVLVDNYKKACEGIVVG